MADPTLDAFIARLAESDLSSHTTTVGWICGGPDLAVWCRACCVRALTRHVATLRDDAAYHADCRPNRRAAEAAQATLDAIRAEVERSTPQPPGGQQVGPRPDLWSMTPTTRRALSRLLGNAALTVAPPSLVALHAAWRDSADVLSDLGDNGGGEDLEAFGVACDRVDAALDSLLGWTPEETP